MDGKRLSNSVYLCRYLAIIAVAIAHTSFSRNGIDLAIRITDSFANAGVAVFFFCSGIYYKKHDFNAVIKKLIMLVIPWGIWGTAVYFISNVSISNYSIQSYLSWMLGKGTYLWYITVYTVIFIVINISPKFTFKFIPYILISITLFSRLLSAILGIDVVICYLNPFNWIGFVMLGIIVKKKILVKICGGGHGLKYSVLISFFIIIIGLLIDQKLDSKLGYFGYSSFIGQCFWIWILFSVSILAESKIPLFIKKIGEESFPIYLIHIVVVGYLCNRFGINIFFNILIAILSVHILYFLLKIGYIIAMKLGLEKYYCTLTGFRV